MVFGGAPAIFDVLSCSHFVAYPCGKSSDVIERGGQEEEASVRIDQGDKRAMDMSIPKEHSFDNVYPDRDHDLHRTPSTAIVTPQKKMMTTSSDFQYVRTTSLSPPSSSEKKQDNPDTSRNISPSSITVETSRTQSQHSPFQDMWQKYSAGSLQTLEEGKQMLQRQLISFFEGDSCMQANCNNTDAMKGQSPRSAPMHDATELADARGSASQIKNENLRQSPTSHGDRNSDKATASYGESSDAQKLMENNQQPISLANGESRSPLGGRRSAVPVPPYDFQQRSPAGIPQQSPFGNPGTSHENIEVNSEHEVKVIEPTHSPGLPPTPPVKKAPLETLEVCSEDASALERSISELTMRSSYGGGESLADIPDNRRMAYYAVGKNHRQSGRGGNRRCYFSGKLILGGAPFYAGAVQQGLRTLVVFCLPSALNLPDRERMLKLAGGPTRRPSNAASINSSTGGSGPNGILRDTRANRSLASRSANRSRRGLRAMLQTNNSMNNDCTNSIASNSRMTSLDDLSLSIDGDLDPNWGIDRDLLLQVLPEADAKLLDAMASLFPEQYETLPVQVRDAARWRLYVKFCFFSGLPIAEGEMHYKVLDELAEQVYGEEIVLSHDVMEAVNGNVSAEILQLPNQKVFRYLSKHYTQQCSKLDERVFRRSAWLRIAPEV